MGARQSAGRSAVNGRHDTPALAAVPAAAGESKSDGRPPPPRVTGLPVCRVKALSALSHALDELNVFIPPPIQLIIVKLTISQRGTVRPAPAPTISTPRCRLIGSDRPSSLPCSSCRRHALHCSFQAVFHGAQRRLSVSDRHKDAAESVRVRDAECLSACVN
jgi:hypothetical protein